MTKATGTRAGGREQWPPLSATGQVQTESPRKPGGESLDVLALTHIGCLFWGHRKQAGTVAVEWEELVGWEKKVGGSLSRSTRLCFVNFEPCDCITSSGEMFKI